LTRNSACPVALDGQAVGPATALPLASASPSLVDSLIEWIRFRGTGTFRCQRITVSGLTITRADCQPSQSLDSPTQRTRSEGRSCARSEVRRYAGQLLLKSKVLEQNRSETAQNKLRTAQKQLAS
jgi:hypothetical protein